MDFSKINVLGLDVFCKDLVARDTPYADVRRYGADLTGDSDCTAQVQSAVNSNASIIVFPNGTYKLSSIKIPSNKLLIGFGTKIIANSNNVFINNSDGSVGQYDANSNITIVGFDFSADAIGTCTEIGFSHCNNIVIENCSFHDNSAWHMIELNSCNNSRINNCHFYNNKTVSGSSEMLQLDSAVNQGVFPWFGPYDSTPCKNIIISNCSFDNSSQTKVPDSYNSAIGNHTSAIITNIEISNCTFTAFGRAIKFISLYNSSISNCNFNECCTAINFYGIAQNILIDSNVIVGNRNNNYSAGYYYRGIYVSNDSKENKNIICTNNDVSQCMNHGIAIEGTDCNISNNTVHDNGVSGIVFGYSSYKSKCCNNLCYNNGSNSTPNSFDLGININKALDAYGDFVISGNNVGRFRCYNLDASAYVPSVITNNICSELFDPAKNSDGEYFDSVYNNCTEKTNSEHIVATIQSGAVNYSALTWNTMAEISIAESGFYCINSVCTFSTTNIAITLDITGGSQVTRQTATISDKVSTTSINLNNVVYVAKGTILSLRIYPSSDLSFINNGYLTATRIPISATH